MRLSRALVPSLRSLFAHRMRTALAAAGMAVGVLSVSLTRAVGQGAEAEILRSVGAMGSRLFVVRPEQVNRTSARKELRGFVSSLKLEDADPMEQIGKIEAVAPSVEGLVKIHTTAGLVKTQLLGTSPAFFRIREFMVRDGRVFSEDENRALARVAVLGGRAALTLFPNEEPVGREIRVGTVRFEVIGTLTAKGASADGADADNQVFVPVRTALRRVFDARSLSRVFVGVREANDLGPAEDEVRALLRERHRLTVRNRPDDFAVQDQLRYLSAQRQTARALGYVTSGLAAVSLLIGGTGIFALMLLSVRERTPEIGLRMAVGARRRDILLQFLAEAVALALLGGAAGAVLGVAGAWAAASMTGWPVQPSASAALLSLGVSVAIGFSFGALPARKAALLPPARALGLE